MSDNSGEKSRNSSPVSSEDMTWSGGDKVPQVSSTKAGGGLRGMEANTAENKGNATPIALSGTRETGTLDESY